MAFETASNDIDKFLFLSYAEVNSIIHHLSYFVELSGWDVESQDVFAWLVHSPVKVVSFISTDNKNILFVENYDLSLRNLLIEDLEVVPTHLVEIVIGMLVKLGEIEHLVFERSLSLKLLVKA